MIYTDGNKHRKCERHFKAAVRYVFLPTGMVNKELILRVSGLILRAGIEGLTTEVETVIKMISFTAFAFFMDFVLTESLLSYKISLQGNS